MTAADLRHSLRTPLNHIIGYGEMIEESNGAAGVPALPVLLSDAKELVGFIQQAFEDGDNPVTDSELRDFQNSCCHG